jgi:hypothetical protein
MPVFWCRRLQANPRALRCKRDASMMVQACIH